jgi:hypothetical protein
MGNLVVLEGGNGGALVMPKFRIAFSPQPTDVLLMNVHEMHGNLMFTGERLTAVLYARKHIHECGSETGANKDRGHKTIFGPPQASSSHRGSLESSDSEIKQESESVINAEHKYDPNFLSKEEADALFTLAQSLPRERALSKLSGFKYGLRRLQIPCYSATPNWRGSENEKTNQWMLPLDEAPAEVKSLAEKLGKLAGKPVNYFSFVGYENEKDHIDWHQHREDKCRDARVFVVSLGEVLTFGIRKLCDECRVCDDCNKRMCGGETQPSC